MEGNNRNNNNKELIKTVEELAETITKEWENKINNGKDVKSFLLKNSNIINIFNGLEEWQKREVSKICAEQPGQIPYCKKILEFYWENIINEFFQKKYQDCVDQKLRTTINSLALQNKLGLYIKIETLISNSAKLNSAITDRINDAIELSDTSKCSCLGDFVFKLLKGGVKCFLGCSNISI